MSDFTVPVLTCLARCYFITLYTVENNDLRRRALSAQRERLLELLSQQSGGTTIAALVKFTGLHENTIRGHLNGLHAAGFVTRTLREPDGKGRPATLWSAQASDPQAGYAGLAGALARALAEHAEDPQRAAREAGQAWGRGLATKQDERSDPRAGVVDLMTNLGYDPDTSAGLDEIYLRACPLLEAAAQHEDVVCAVHFGLVQGALNHFGASDDGSELIPFSAPHQCTLRLRARV